MCPSQTVYTVYSKQILFNTKVLSLFVLTDISRIFVDEILRKSKYLGTKFYVPRIFKLPFPNFSHPTAHSRVE